MRAFWYLERCLGPRARDEEEPTRGEAPGATASHGGARGKNVSTGQSVFDLLARKKETKKKRTSKMNERVFTSKAVNLVSCKYAKSCGPRSSRARVEEMNANAYTLFTMCSASSEYEQRMLCQLNFRWVCMYVRPCTHKYVC